MAEPGVASGDLGISHGGNMITLIVNGQSRQVDAADDTPLLWVIREQLPARSQSNVGCIRQAFQRRVIILSGFFRKRVLRLSISRQDRLGRPHLKMIFSQPRHTAHSATARLARGSRQAARPAATAPARAR